MILEAKNNKDPFSTVENNIWLVIALMDYIFILYD